MDEKTNSSILRAKLDLFGRSVNEAYRQFWEQPDPKAHYPAYLIQLHQIVRASVPLMEAARRRAAELSDGDPVCAALVGYFDEHIEEERSHDQWILEDLEAMGVPRLDVLGRAPSARVAAFVGAQYYWIAHHHPIALLSYIALLEEPPSLDFLDRLQRRTGLPKAAFRTLREHGLVDPGHGNELDHFMDALPLTRAHHEIIGISVVHAASALEDCLREILPTPHPS